MLSICGSNVSSHNEKERRNDRLDLPYGSRSMVCKMTLKKAIRCCAVREAVYRTKKPQRRYYKNHPISLRSRIAFLDRIRRDWAVYDPRDDDSGSLFSFND